MSRRVRFGSVVCVAAILLALSFSHFLFFRDNFTTHYPTLTVASSILRGGELPLWNPLAGGGQPLAGNPNYLVFYPTTLLYLLLPAHVAFNLHFFLHLAIAWFAMRALLRRLQVPESTAAAVATLYCLSGVALSCLAFYNLIVAVALIPAALAALMRLADRPSATCALQLGAICGLLLLAAEPMTLIGFVMLSLAAIDRRIRRTIPYLLFAAVVTLGVVAPLILAATEVRPELERFVEPFDANWGLLTSVGPLKLLELIVGPVRGSMLDASARGLAANVHAYEPPPFFLSLLIGALLLPALMTVTRGPARRFAFAFAAMLFLALGRWNPIVHSLYERFAFLRIARYPEKLLLPGSVAAFVLIALLLEASDSSRSRVAAWIACAIAIGGVAAALAVVPLTRASQLQLLLGLVLQVATLIAFATRARFLALPIAAAAMLYWAFLTIPIDRNFWYVAPSPVAAQLAGQSIAALAPVPTTPARESHRVAAFRALPLFGMRNGIAYPLAGSPDGMFSFETRRMVRHFAALPPPMLARYLRLRGVTGIVTPSRMAAAEIVPRAAYTDAFGTVYVCSVTNQRPAVTVAGRVIRNADEFAAIEHPGFDVTRDAVCRDCDVAVSSGSARITSKSTQRMSIAFSGAGGLVVTDQTYFRAWQALTGDGHPLATIRVNVDRLGVIVPGGVHDFELTFSRRRSFIAITWILSLILQLAICCLSIKK